MINFIENNGILLDTGNHDTLLVVFGGISQGIGIPVFEFFNSISGIECDKMFLRDFHQAWYQKGIDSTIDHIDALIGFLRQSIVSYRKVCFVGNSMGGYAAILFGGILDVDKVLAFSPQTFIDKTNRTKYQDNRWSEQINKVHEYMYRKEEYFDLTGIECKDIAIYYSLDDRLDKIHAERLSVKLNPMSKGGHSAVKELRDANRLKDIISEFITC